MNTNQKLRRWRKKNPKRVALHNRKYFQNNKKKIYKARKIYTFKYKQLVHLKLGGKCAKCGNKDHRVLQIDHRNGGGTQEYNALKRDRFALWKRVLTFPKLYQLLCANCNWIKRWENNEN